MTSPNLLWSPEAWEEYLDWQKQDKRTMRQINRLIRDIQRSPFKGIGKPEPLKGNLSGWWSRHIDPQNRLVYRLSENRIEIAQCKTHYGDG